MEIKNNKRRNGILIAAIALGVGGWGTLAWGYSNNKEEAPGNSDNSERITVQAETDKPDKVIKEEPVEESEEEVIEGVTQESGEAIKQEEAKEVKRVKDISELESDQYLDDVTDSFLTQWSFVKSRVLKTLLTENQDVLNGLYVYSSTVLKVGDTVEMELGFSKEKVSKKLINSYEDIFNNPRELEEGLNGIALVDYDKGKITNIDWYEESSTRDEIQHAILNTDIIKKEKFTSKEEQKELEDTTHEYLTADDWKGMTLLASRDIVDNDMAPIFVVPNTSLSQKSGDFEGTYYYVVAGVLKSISTDYTKMFSYEGKTFSLDFGNVYATEHVGKPVWMHVVTEDGIVRNVEVQPFDGANMKTMAEGMMSYIGVASAELNQEGTEE